MRRAGDVDTALNLVGDEVAFLVPGRPPMYKDEFAKASKSRAGPR